MGKNGYFQLLMSETVTFVRLYPPTDGAAPISIDEIRDYLAGKGYRVDILDLKNVIETMGDKQVDYRVADKRTLPVGETFSLRVSADRMQAIARFYPPSTAAPALTMENIVSELEFRGIKKGICESVISDFLSDKQYCTDYVIAQGQPPVRGTNASIEYFFNTNPNMKPKLNDDGTVDFFNLSNISKVTKGQVLATLTKEVPGEAGYNVVGEVMKAPDVRRMILKFGRNIELTEDGLSIISLVDGHASLVDDKVFVSDVYEVTDVDASTGNIDYKGNVSVMGNVKAGFSVVADGNVEVRGVVEGAIIEATGDIIIMRGMNGMGKGVLKAGGNVVSKFLENTTVTAGGYVHSEAIMHSTISCKGDVDVTGKKGFITGGVIRSQGTVSAKTIGSSMGAATEIEVGIDPVLKAKSVELQQNIAANKKKVEQLEPVIITFTKKIKAGERVTPDQLQYFKQLSVQYQTVKQQLNSDIDTFTDMQDELENCDNASAVKVSEFAYNGTKITISDAILNISTPISHSRFVKEGADVRIRAL